MLRIDEREIDGITVVCLHGRLVFGDASACFTRRLTELMTEKKTRILVHVEAMTFIDSSGIGDLIAGFTELRKVGGTLKLSAPTDQVLQVLKIVRMPSIIEIYDTEQEALASFT